MNTPHSTRIGWLVSALITSGTVAAFILVFLLHPLAAGAAPSTQHAAQAAAAPVLTGHPQIARKNNRYNDALVAKKLSRLHKLVRPLDTTNYVASHSYPVIFVHGFNSNASIDCKASYWGTAISFLHNTAGWQGSLVTVGYYKGDHDCDAYLGNYAAFCASENAGNQGTTNEDLRHVSCELAWYIWENYTQYGINVQLVGHSMGGLLIRQALYDTPIDIYLPPYLLAQDAVTMSTPHGGIPIVGAAFFICGNCLQAEQMRTNNPFWETLNSYGQNPQGAGWGTDWTMFGSSCESWYNVFDPGVDWHSALDMTGGHKTEYLNPPCYDHGGYLKDTSTSFNADANWCDGCGADVVSNSSKSWPRSLENMALALDSQYW